MAETTLLRSSNIVRNASPGATSGKPHATVSGQHKVVNVAMGANGPQISNGQQTKSGVTILPPKAGTRSFTTGGLPNQGAKSSVTVFPPKDPRFAGAANAIAEATEESSRWTPDGLLLSRHLLDNYIKEAKTAAGEAELSQAAIDNVKVAEEAIATIDAEMAAITAAAAAAAAAEAAAVAAAAAAAARPAPRAVGVGSRQVAASATPRRVARPNGPPPPRVDVRMEGKVPVPQTPAVVATPVDLPVAEAAVEGDAAQG
jgi:hypothetical protein